MIDQDTLLAEWEHDARLCKEDLTGETLRIASLHPKYLRYLMEGKRAKAKVQNKYDQTLHVITRYYQGLMEKSEMDKLGLPYDPYNGAAKPLKSNMGPWIENDRRMRKVVDELTEIKDSLAAIEEIIGTIRWRHNAVKNILESKKFDAGY